MARVKQITKDKFLKAYRIEDDFAQAARSNDNLWNELMLIYKHYSSEFSRHCKTTAEGFFKEVYFDSNNNEIYSIKQRVKSPDSLLVKIVNRLAKVPEVPSDNRDIEKYRDISLDNYYEVITDLIGLRILIRYRHQWESVHNWIYNMYYKGDEYFLENQSDGLTNKRNVSFLAEKPKVYLGLGEDRQFYEQYGKGVFDIRTTNSGYNSVWIVNSWSDRNYKVHAFLNSTGDRYPRVPCRRMLLNQCM